MSRAKRLAAAILGLLLMFTLTACGDSSPAASTDAAAGEPQQQLIEVNAEDVDGPGTWANTELPLYPDMYTLTGVVVGPANSIVRQTEAASGDVSGIGVGGLGYMSGSYAGPVVDGKSLIRIHVATISPAADEFARPGEMLIVKATDTKASVLMDGDAVTFVCRLEAELVGALTTSEDRNSKQFLSREFDYCRLEAPRVSPAQ